MATYGWDPETGEQKLFDSNDAREEAGFLDYHPQDAAKNGSADKTERAPRHRAPKTPKPGDDGGGDAKVKVLTRAEIIAAFTEGGVTDYDKEARVEVLDAQLNAIVRSAIKAKTGTEPEADTPTRTMLEMVRAS